MTTARAGDICRHDRLASCSTVLRRFAHGGHGLVMFGTSLCRSSIDPGQHDPINRLHLARAKSHLGRAESPPARTVSSTPAVTMAESKSIPWPEPRPSRVPRGCWARSRALDSRTRKLVEMRRRAPTTGHWQPLEAHTAGGSSLADCRAREVTVAGGGGNRAGPGDSDDSLSRGRPRRLLRLLSLGSGHRVHHGTIKGSDGFLRADRIAPQPPRWESLTRLVLFEVGSRLESVEVSLTLSLAAARIALLMSHPSVCLRAYTRRCPELAEVTATTSYGPDSAWHPYIRNASWGIRMELD
jgi:hypothetical protein